MARKCKCRYCGKELTTDKAVYQEVYMKNSSKKLYYCNYDEMRQARIDKECWEWSMKGIDVLAGEPLSPTTKARKIKSILDKGYTRQDVYMALCELRTSLGLSYKMEYEIEYGYQKLSYIMSAVENNIDRIHNENIATNKEDKYIPTFEEFKVQEKLPIRRKKTLAERIGGNNE